MPLPRVTVVVPHFNQSATLRACLEAARDLTRYPLWDLVVVDNGSSDGSLKWLERERGWKLLREPKRGVAHAMNRALSATSGDIVRLHADVVIETPDWLERLVETRRALPKAGVVGGRLLFPDGRIQAEGRSFITGVGFHLQHHQRRAFESGDARGSEKPVEVDGVPGALGYYSREVLQAVGGWDAGYGPQWTEDDDFCVAARRRGFKVHVDPAVRAVHCAREWAPTSVLCFQDSDALVRQLTWAHRFETRKRHAARWEAKWGWDPFHPDLQEIRRLYGDTEICWRIGEAMRYRPSAEVPTVDACIVTWNNLALLRRCLESLAQTDYPRERLKVFIADNRSTDGTLAYLESLAANFPFPVVLSRLAVNAGAPVGLNWAIVQGEGELVARLDDDIVLPSDWLKTMVGDLQRRPFAGMVGPKIINDNATQTIQCGPYRHYPSLYGHEDEPDAGQADYLARAVHVRGCCNLYRRDVFTHCGLLDVRYSPSQFDDPDHHIALAVAGYELLYDGRVRVIHKLNTGVARSQAAVANQHANASKMYGKWGQDIFAVLERSLDQSREGRYLPDDGNTSVWLAQGPSPVEFPRRDVPATEEKNGEAAASKAPLPGSPEAKARLAELIEEHLRLASARLRDGFPRQALDILHTALNLEPAHPAVYRELARAYVVCGQPENAATLARRACRLFAGQSAVASQMAEFLNPPAPPVNGEPAAGGNGARPNDRSDHIGEAAVTVSQQSGGNGTPRRLRVLMVNSFENRVAGGDMHQLKKTRQHLLDLGVEVDVACSPRPDVRGYDLVHVWNLWFPHQTLPQLKAIRVQTPEVPVVLSTIYWDMAEKAWADHAVPHLFQSARSAAQLEESLSQLANDKILVGGRRRSQAPEPNFPGYERYQREILTLVDHLLPQSRAEVACLERVLGVTRPFTVVPNAAEGHVFDQASADWFQREFGRRDFVLTVGLVEPRKNQLMLLRALRDTGLPVVVIGRNYDRGYLRLCREHAPKDTLFIEHLPHEQLASAFKAARVHALPSWMECAAFVNLEAALSGCSLVVSDRTSEAEYFGDDAYYCNPADVESIRSAVVRAWEQHAEDAPKRERLKARFHHEWTWRHVAEQTLAGYERALAARRTPALAPLTSEVTTPALPGIPQGPVPEVSIVIPVFNRLDFTQRCLQALRQVTPAGNFEVIVVDNGSTDGTPAYLEGLSRAGQLRSIRNARNRGFAVACNQGAAAARGRFVLFLNNDTAPRAGWLEALLEIARRDAGVAAVGSRLLYPDGTVQHAGIGLFDDQEHGDPLQARNLAVGFPAEDPRVLRGRELQALTAACLLVRKDALDAAGGFDEGYWNGYEDVDLCLRLRERGGRLVYQPRSVVTHWESRSGPERFLRAGENVRRLHERWRGKVSVDFVAKADGTIQPVATTPIREYSPAVEAPAALVSIVILVLNQLEHTRRCVDSLLAHTRAPFELIFVDNGSNDGTAAYLKELRGQHDFVKVITNAGNRGFAAGNNQGLAVAHGDYVVLLNNDTVVTPGWIEGLLRALASRADLGIVGPMSNRVSGPQYVPDAGYASLDELPAFARRWSAEHAGEWPEVRRVVGFCLAAKRAVIEAIGGLDEQFGTGNFEDDDFCLRAALAGFRAAIARDVFIHHAGSQTFKGARIDYRAAMLRNWALFKAKWHIAPESPLEKGYATPATRPEGLELRVPLASLETSHEETLPGRFWRECKANAGLPAKAEVPVAAKVGRLDEAREFLRRKEWQAAWCAGLDALQRRPFHPEACLLMAEAALGAGDGNRARACVERARALAPDWAKVKHALKAPFKGAASLDWPGLPPLPKTPRLSVCLIARNEERFLPQCLASVKELAQQIVLVDTGSTDRTAALAREAGAEVMELAWEDDFSAARNAALERATGDWVLILDCDEVLTAEGRASLAGELQRRDVLMWRLPIVEAGDESAGAHYVPRLFRNAPGAHFAGRVHEEVFSSLEPLARAWGLESRQGATRLRHHGYSAEVSEARGKTERNLRLLELALRERPDQPHLWMSRGLALAQSGRLTEGIDAYSEAWRLLSQREPAQVAPEMRETLLLQYTTRLLGARRFEEVIHLLSQPLALAQGGLSASLHFNLGLARLEMKQWEPSAQQFEACLAKRGQASAAPALGEIRGAAPHHCRARCLAALNRRDEARQAFQAAMAAEPDAVAARIDYAAFLHDVEEPIPALELLHGLIASRPDCAPAWLLGGRIATSRPDFLEFAEDWAAEATRALPGDSRMKRLRARVLLLRDKPAAAVEAWSELTDSSQPEDTAASLLSALAAGVDLPVVPAAWQETVGREFLAWYQKLLRVRAHVTLAAVNANLARLEGVLPETCRVLSEALREDADTAATHPSPPPTTTCAGTAGARPA